MIGVTGGSFSTVGAMVKAWKAEQAASATPVIEMPEAITKAMHRAAADIWGAASALAGEALERMKTETGAALGKAQSELAEYAGEVSRLEGDLEGANKNAATTEKRLDTSKERIAELTAGQGALEARLADRDAELNRLRSDYQKLQTELIEIAKQKLDSAE